MMIRRTTAIRMMTRKTIITDPIIMAEITKAKRITDQIIMVLSTMDHPITVLQMVHQM